jgi:hypothetical protein
VEEHQAHVQHAVAADAKDAELETVRAEVEVLKVST